MNFSIKPNKAAVPMMDSNFFEFVQDNEITFASTYVSKTTGYSLQDVQSVFSLMTQIMAQKRSKNLPALSNMYESCGIKILIAIYEAAAHQEKHATANTFTGVLYTAAPLMLESVVSRGKERQLKKVIKNCEEIIVSSKIKVPEIDELIDSLVFSNNILTIQELRTFLSACIYSTSLYRFFMKETNLSHSKKEQLTRIQPLLWEEISQLFLNSYISKAKKECVNLFAAVTSDILEEFFSTTIMPKLLGSPLQDGAAEDNLPQTEMMLLVKQRLSSIQEKRADKRILDKYQNTLQNPAMVLMGFLFLIQEKPSWIGFNGIMSVYYSVAIKSCNNWAVEQLGTNIQNLETTGMLDELIEKQAQDVAAVLNFLHFKTAEFSISGLPISSEQLMRTAFFQTFLPKSALKKEPAKQIGREISEIYTIFDDLSPLQKGIIGALTYLSYMDMINPPGNQTSENPNLELLKKLADSEETISSLQRKLSGLETQQGRDRHQQKEMSAKTIELERKLQAKEKEIEALYGEKMILQENCNKMLGEMQEILNNQILDEAPDNESTFPISLDGKKIISYGGFSSFIQALQSFIPELIIKESSNRPDPLSICRADAVFMQINNLSHSNFYYVQDLCRRNKVPVFVYVNSGAKRCALQILSWMESCNPS